MKLANFSHQIVNMNEFHVDLILNELNEVKNTTLPAQNNIQLLEQKYSTSLQNRILHKSFDAKEDEKELVDDHLLHLRELYHVGSDTDQLASFPLETQKDLLTIEELQKRKNLLLSIKSSISLLKELSTALEQKEISLFTSEEIEYFAPAVNDQRMSPILSKNKKLQEFKKLVNSRKEKTFKYDTQVYYLSLKDAVDNVIKKYFTKAPLEPKHKKFSNLIAHYNDLKNDIEILCANFNEDGYGTENVLFQMNNCFQDFISSCDNKSMLYSHSYLYGFYFEHPSFSSLLDSSLRTAMKKMDSLISELMNKGLQNTSSTPKDLIDSLISITKPEWFTEQLMEQSIIKSRNLVINSITKLDYSNQKMYIKYIIQKGFFKAFKDNLLISFQKTVETTILETIFAKYSCMKYLYYTLPQQIDKNSNDFICARNLVKYGPLYTFYKYDTKIYFDPGKESNQNYTDFLKKMKKNIAISIFEAFYMKLGEICQRSIILQNIE